MSAIGQNQVDPLPRPAGATEPTLFASIVRGNDNIIVQAFNAHDASASLHIVTTSTAGVTTGATSILAAVTGACYALVSGDDGSGKAFVDQVVWYGSGSATAVSGTTVKGAPAARTYSVSSGALQLAMASGTYTITAVPVVFTT